MEKKEKFTCLKSTYREKREKKESKNFHKSSEGQIRERNRID